MAKNFVMSAEYLGSVGILRALAGGTPLAKKIGKKAFVKFARATRDDMRAHAPEDKGKLRKSIKARSTRSGGAQVYGDRRVAPHTHFADAGTKARKTKKGANRGKVKGTKWISEAQRRALARFKAEVSAPLLAELANAIKRGATNV